MSLGNEGRLAVASVSYVCLLVDLCSHDVRICMQAPLLDLLVRHMDAKGKQAKLKSPQGAAGAVGCDAGAAR